MLLILFQSLVFGPGTSLTLGEVVGEMVPMVPADLIESNTNILTRQNTPLPNTPMKNNRYSHSGC